MKTFYTNAKIFRNGRFEPGLIAVEGGRIAAAGEPRPGDRVVDLGGRHLVPGLVDVHVHLREPGFPQKETIATGTAGVLELCGGLLQNDPVTLSSSHRTFGIPIASHPRWTGSRRVRPSLPAQRRIRRRPGFRLSLR